MLRGVALTATVLALATAVTGCGASSTPQPSASASHASPTSIQVTQQPATIDVRNLETGSAAHQITSAIVTFYRATWQANGSLACSLFSPAGVTGFMKAAQVAFPDTLNGKFTCPQAMAYFHATLADSVNTLQQAGVNVSGNVLDNVGVQHIAVHGATATAQAPEGVPEFIKPKLFMLVRVNSRWLIEGSKKLGKTLPQLLAQAKAKGQLRAK
jgi:hypothetical protein